MDRYFDLGHDHRAITTRSAEAQRWFDQGWNWCSAFHHEEGTIGGGAGHGGYQREFILLLSTIRCVL